MAECMPGEIWIGGRIPAALVPDLCAAVGREAVALEWGDYDFAPATDEDLLEALRPNKSGVRLLRLCNSQARWGQFVALERFMEEHRIAYTRFSAGQQDYDHEKVEFRPTTGRTEMVSNSQGEPVVAASRLQPLDSTLVRAVESARSGSVEAAIGLVQSARRSLKESLPGEMPPLQPFEIVAGLRRPRPVSARERAPF